MGCGSSRPSRTSCQSTSQPGTELNRVNWTPHGTAVAINPRDRPHSTERASIPQCDKHGREIRQPQHQLNRDMMLSALTSAAEYIRQKGGNFTIITLGGALNVMLLQSRVTSENVNFFAHPVTKEDARLLEAAAQHVAAQCPGQIGSDWLNNRVTNLIPRELRPTLVQRALQQNTVVFQQPGLTVLAAPWSYSIAAKIDRIFLNRRSGPDAYDEKDVAHYLRAYIQTHSNQPVPVHIIQQWARVYGIDAPVDIVRQINAQYRQLFGTDGVII
ncbi:hypothetical protein B0O99DRAFT_690126 [Bisporella sp. PMI_857]|nr:hypothetical protein B0O99DRAFT_690126 [Bisporella sp. PMI_857]